MGAPVTDPPGGCVDVPGRDRVAAPATQRPAAPAGRAVGCDRRTLLCGVALAVGAGAVSACSGASPTRSTASSEDLAPATSQAPDPPSSAGTSALTTLDAIAVGGAASVEAPDGTPLVVVRTSATEAHALSAVCTHQGCTVAPDGAALACPCHGSRFTLDGKVTNGPARRALTPFAVAVVDGAVVPA